MTTFDDLDALLSGDEPDWDEAPEAPVDADRANGYLRSLARERARLQEARDVAQAERDRIDLFLSVVEAKAGKRIQWLETALELFHQSLLADDPRRKSMALPNGTLKVRAQQDQWEFTDEFIEWAQTVNPKLVREKPPPPPEVDKTAAKKTLLVAAYSGDQGLVVSADGEKVPGVTVTKRPPKFYVETEVRP